jgi:hypothetical protein
MNPFHSPHLIDRGRLPGRLLTSAGLVLAMALLPACGLLFLVVPQPKPAEEPVAPRPAGHDCIRTMLIFRSPHLGGGSWGALEFVGVHKLAVVDYAVCPKGQVVPALSRSLDTKDSHLVALIPCNDRRTESEAGALFRYQSYDAYFRGCFDTVRGGRCQPLDKK